MSSLSSVQSIRFYTFLFFGHSRVTRDSYKSDLQGNGSYGNFHNFHIKNISSAEHSNWSADQDVKEDLVCVEQLGLNTLPANISGDHVIEFIHSEAEPLKM